MKVVMSLTADLYPILNVAVSCYLWSQWQVVILSEAKNLLSRWCKTRCFATLSMTFLSE